VSVSEFGVSGEKERARILGAMIQVGKLIEGLGASEPITIAAIDV